MLDTSSKCNSNSFVARNEHKQTLSPTEDNCGDNTIALFTIHFVLFRVFIHVHLFTDKFNVKRGTVVAIKFSNPLLVVQFQTR